MATAPVQGRPAHAPQRRIAQLPSRRVGSGAGAAGGGRGPSGPRTSRPPRCRRRERSPAARRSGAGNGRCPARPSRLCAGHPSRRRGVASWSGWAPNQRSAGAPCATPRVRDIQRRDRRLRLPLSQAGTAARSSRGAARKGVGRFLKKGLAPELGPGPPGKPALHPNAPPGPADFGRDVSRGFTRLWPRESLHVASRRP